MNGIYKIVEKYLFYSSMEREYASQKITISMS